MANNNLIDSFGGAADNRFRTDGRTGRKDNLVCPASLKWQGIKNR